VVDLDGVGRDLADEGRECVSESVSRALVPIFRTTAKGKATGLPSSGARSGLMRL
jgi:hypothetical protein